MTVILNESEWAKDMIKQRSLGKKPFETLYRVAGYYIESGYRKKEVRKNLESFLLQCEPTASVPKWSNIIDSAIDRATKYKQIKIECIYITKPEMERIEEIQSKQIRRLAFTLLCLAKYWDAVNPNGDHWVNNRDTEIMKLANISTSVKRQSSMYHALIDEGFIRPSKKIDNTNVRVCFMEDGDPAMQITDFRNLGYQYMKYHGEPYFECQNCGIVTKYSNPKKGGKQKYCKACAAEIAMQQRINSVMRQREKEKQIE